MFIHPLCHLRGIFKHLKTFRFKHTVIKLLYQCEEQKPPKIGLPVRQDQTQTGHCPQETHTQCAASPH